MIEGVVLKEDFKITHGVTTGIATCSWLAIYYWTLRLWKEERKVFLDVTWQDLSIIFFYSIGMHNGDCKILTKRATNDSVIWVMAPII